MPALASTATRVMSRDIKTKAKVQDAIAKSLAIVVRNYLSEYKVNSKNPAEKGLLKIFSKK